MPRGQKPQGEQALSNAERQARYRARHEGDKPRPVVRYRRPADRRTRPQRWNDAAAELIVVQAECAAWWDAMPEGLRDTPTGEALRAIVELDLDAISSVCRATIKVRIPDNQDEKVVAELVPQGGRSPTGGASPATTGDKALSRASIVM